MANDKIRADQLLVSLGLASSRAVAAKLIKGQLAAIKVAQVWQPLVKPSQLLPPDAELQITASEATRYVSRGAFKLKHALEKANIDVTDMTALDVGQSTGGFTDCLLQNGVNKVVGVDVGRDQLAEKLRQDPRVVCLEGINGRELPQTTLLSHSPGGFDLIVMDVSFISQTLILPNLVPLLKPGAWLVSLVKPQFEVGREGVGKGGIVRDTSLYPQVQNKIEQMLSSLELDVLNFIDSPIEGGDGNREFLMIAKNR